MYAEILLLIARLRVLLSVRPRMGTARRDEVIFGHTNLIRE